MGKGFVPSLTSIVRRIISHGIAHFFWAALMYLGWFAPDSLIMFLIDGLPEFFTPYVARVLLVGTAVLVLLITLRPRPRQKHQSPSWLFGWLKRQKQDSIHDVDLLDVINYVMHGQWGTELNWQSPQVELDALKRACIEIRQKSCYGELRVWGAKVYETFYGDQSSDLLILIEPVYWRHYGIDENAAMIGDAKELVTVQIESGAQGENQIYRNLTATKSEVERLWPSGNI